MNKCNNTIDYYFRRKYFKTQLKKMFNKFKENKNNVKSNGELDEFVGYDGSFLGSNIPMLNQRLDKKCFSEIQN